MHNVASKFCSSLHTGKEPSGRNDESSHKMQDDGTTARICKQNKIWNIAPSSKCSFYSSIVSERPEMTRLDPVSTDLATTSSPSFARTCHPAIQTQYSDTNPQQNYEKKDPLPQSIDVLTRKEKNAKGVNRFNFDIIFKLKDILMLTNYYTCHETSKSVRGDNSAAGGGEKCRVTAYAGRRRKFFGEHEILWRACSLLLFGVAMICATAAHDTELCVVEDPLETPYFTPLLEGAASCLLCRRTPPADAGSLTGELSSLYREVKQVLVVDHRGSKPQEFTSPNQGDDVTVQVQLSDSVNSGTTVALVIHSTCDKCSFSVMIEAQGSTGVNLLLLTRDPALVRLVTPPDAAEAEVSALQILFLPFNFTGDDRPESLVHFTSTLFITPITYVSTEQATLVSIDAAALEGTAVPECPTGDGWGNASASHAGDGVLCKRQTRQHLSGCYHHHMIGNHAQDIHIIDVQGSGNTNGSLVLEVHGLKSRQHSLLPSEGFSFGGNLSLVGAGARVRRGPVLEEDLVVRNITLVLRSVRPVTWLVRPSSIQGTITVLLVGDGQMENGSSAQYGRQASGVTVVTKKETMPTSFDQFILTVLSRVGYPISYTNSTVPNKIIVTVPSDNEYHSSADVRHEPRVFQRKTDALALLKEELRVECSSSGAVVAVPTWAADGLPSGGPVTLVLSDPSCRSTSNGTHLFISAPFRDCNFQRLNHPGYTTYTNSIHITMSAEPVSDDEDLAGSGLGPDETSDLLSITCDVNASIEDVMSTQTFDEGDNGQYKLEVYTASSGDVTGLTPQQLSSRHAFVERGAFLHVSASLRSKLGMEDLLVVLESCWFEPLQETPWEHSRTSTQALTTSSPLTPESQAGLSTSPFFMVTPQLPPTTSPIHQSGKNRKSRKKNKGSSHRNRAKKISERIEVVRKSCAVLPFVVVNPAASSFSLKMGEEFATATEWRLQCSVGVCSPGSLPRPALNKCTKPSSYCEKEDLMRLFKDQAAASQLQNVQFGPIFFQSHDYDPSVRTTDGSSAQSVLVMKGVATEMVFVISFVSFVVGVALTSLLWFLHSKFGCSRGCKSGLRSLEPPRGGACAAPNSGGSTPSSQAPMTVGG